MIYLSASRIIGVSFSASVGFVVMLKAPSHQPLLMAGIGETALSQLNSLRVASGKAETTGLSDSVIIDFATRDPTLIQAIDEAINYQKEIITEFGAEFLMQDEAAMV